MKNKIILEANCEFKDKELREVVDKLWIRLETLNERTKIHTLEIKELRKNIIQFKMEEQKKWKNKQN